jgi:hypothetical protein
VSTAGKRGVLIGGVVVMVAIVTAAVLMFTGGGSGKPAVPATEAAADVSTTPVATTPTAAAQRYLAAFAIGDATTASKLTDDPASAAAALGAAWDALRPTAVHATLGTVGTPSENTAEARYTARWTLSAKHTWSYSGTFGVVEQDGDWHVHWTPAVLHPSLRAGQRLALVTSAPDHTAVVDRDGKPLVTAGAGGTRLADRDFSLLRSALVSRVPASTAFAVERVSASGQRLQTLYGSTGDVKSFRSTLSAGVPSAAKSAADSYGGPAVIVAIDASNGGLLAATQNAHSESSPFTGLYAPGSTFKIVTATAAFEAGIATEDSQLACPLRARIGDRTIENEGFDLGTTTLHHAFARSCNTTFAALASRLPADGLARAADQYGLNADFEIPGLDTQTGKVVPAAGPTEQVEDGIGQGTVLVSPFGEALMAATVAATDAMLRVVIWTWPWPIISESNSSPVPPGMLPSWVPVPTNHWWASP